MSKEISHHSMFKKADTETGYIQCVIKPVYKEDFESLGFVDHPDKLAEKEEKTPKRARRTKAQIEAAKVEKDADNEG